MYAVGRVAKPLKLTTAGEQSCRGAIDYGVPFWISRPTRFSPSENSGIRTLLAMTGADQQRAPSLLLRSTTDTNNYFSSGTDLISLLILFFFFSFVFGRRLRKWLRQYGSVVSNRIGVKFGMNVLHVNTI